MDHAASLVRQAVELGVNYIDTAPSYGTEPAVGKAIKDLGRENVVLSSKGTFERKYPLGLLIKGSAKKIENQLNQSLRLLGVETIDVYHVHGMIDHLIPTLLDKILPVLEKAKQAGKIRHLAVSERFNTDPGHRTLPALLNKTDAFDVLLVGLNMLNPSARERVLPMAIERDLGVEVMFAVRKALSNPKHLRATLDKLIALGRLDARAIDRDDPLGFLIDDDTPTVMDAAYRFCAHVPGVSTVLFGTGNPDHLRANIASLNKGPLSPAKLDQLSALFGQVDCVSGQETPV